MKHLFYIPLHISFLLLISCSDADTPTAKTEPLTDGSTIKMISVSSTDYVFDNVETTRGITYNGTKAIFAWDAKDTLGIFPDKGEQICFSLSEGVGTDNAIIDGGGWALKRTSTYTAYTPFNRENYFRDRNHIVLDYTGQVETGISNADHLGVYDFQASNGTSAVNDKLNFQMKRLNCLWILRLTIPQSGTYKKIIVSAESPIFTKKANLSLDDVYTYTPIEMTSTVSLGLKDVTTTENNQVADFLMMLGPVNMTGQSITVSLIGANNYVYKATRTLSSNFIAGSSKRSSFTLVLDTSSNIGFGGEFTIEDSEI